MPTSTITSKGQTTVPKEIREHLGLRSGSRVDFVVVEGGRVELRPASYDIRDLAGILARPGREPVSVEQMNRAIRDRLGTRP